MSSSEVRDVKRSARLQVSRGMKTVLAGVVILYIASAILAPTSVSKVAQMGMLPFAACLAIVGLGQTLVIQQGGIDLSVAGALAVQQSDYLTSPTTRLLVYNIQFILELLPRLSSQF